MCLSIYLSFYLSIHLSIYFYLYLGVYVQVDGYYARYSSPASDYSPADDPAARDEYTHRLHAYKLDPAQETLDPGRHYLLQPQQGKVPPPPQEN